MPERIRLSRAKGWRKPEGVIVVARPTKWGNPFVVGIHGTHAECVHRFALLCAGYVCISDQKIEVREQKQFIDLVRNEVEALAGHDLACWCPLNATCHADVLLAIANEPRPVDIGRFLIPDRSAV